MGYCRSIIFAAALLAGQNSPCWAAGFAGTFVPEGLYIGGGRLFVTSPSASNPDGCGTATSLGVEMASTAEADRAMAAIITAIATNKTATFWVDGCVSSASGLTVPKVTGVTINK